jgi:hypothetical protein
MLGSQSSDSDGAEFDNATRQKLFGKGKIKAGPPVSSIFSSRQQQQQEKASSSFLSSSSSSEEEEEERKEISLSTSKKKPRVVFASAADDYRREQLPILKEKLAQVRLLTEQEEARIANEEEELRARIGRFEASHPLRDRELLEKVKEAKTRVAKQEKWQTKMATLLQPRGDLCDCPREIWQREGKQLNPLLFERLVDGSLVFYCDKLKDNKYRLVFKEGPDIVACIVLTG